MILSATATQTATPDTPAAPAAPKATKSVKPAAPAKPAAKQAAKPAPKPAAGAKRAAQPAAKTQKPAPKVATPVAAKKDDEKPAKIKLVRDSIAIPKNEYVALGELKLRSAKLGAPVKKTELIRAGIMLLARLNDKELVAATAAVPSLKTGRPPKHK